jgi:dUTP pyrophosphatase
MIKLERLTETAQEPTYGSDHAACFDIRADIEGREVTLYPPWNMEYFDDDVADGVVIPAGWRAKIPTGFIWHLESGYELNILPRSGNSLKHGITLSNAMAVIDEDYDKETFVILHNTSMEPFTIRHGDRMAQGRVSKVIRCDFESLGERKGGFGSSGKS